MSARTASTLDADASVRKPSRNITVSTAFASAANSERARPDGTGTQKTELSMPARVSDLHYVAFAVPDPSVNS